MALIFETTYGTPPASAFTRMPFASTTLGAGLGLGTDPAGNAVKAVLRQTVFFGETLERKRAPPPIIDEKLGAPLSVAAQRLLQAGVGDQLGEGRDAVIGSRRVADIFCGDGEGGRGKVS